MNKTVVLFLSLIVLVVSVAACVLPTPTPPTTKSQQAIDALERAEDQEEAKAAIGDIVSQGHSLGLVDEEGNQLNPNVSGEDVISLTPDDVAVYAMTSGGEHYRTLDHVVAYVADIGMTLESTGRPITTTDLLPDLQAYVDWCFTHPDDPKSTLGLLLAAGPELQVPDSAPQMAGNTPISPLAGMLLLADLLVGLEQEVTQVNASLPEGAHLASRRGMSPRQDKDTLIRVKGLITRIEGLANNTFVGIAAAAYDFLNKDAKTEKQLASAREYLGAVRVLIGHYEFCDHLAVRIVHPDGNRANTVTLEKRGDTIPLESKVVAVYGKTEQVVQQIPFAYTFRLLSNPTPPTQYTLHADADAVLVPPNVENPKYESTLNGHQLQVVTDVAHYELKAQTMVNEEKRTALLYADAILPLDNIDKLLEDWKGTIDVVAKDMKPEELKQVLVILKRDLNPLPTMSIVTFKAQEKAPATATATEPAQATATILPTLSFFPDDCKCPALEAAVAKVEIEEANTIRSEFLHCNYSLKGSGQSEYGGCDLTINSSSSPEATYNQFKRESEFLDSYKEDSANFKVIKEERTDDRYSLILESIPHGYCSGQRLVIYRGQSLLSMDAFADPSTEGRFFVPCEDLLNIMETHAKAIIDKQ